VFFGASDFSFTEQLLLNLAGPLLTVVGIGFFASWITRRAQERREERTRVAQERREDQIREGQRRREDLALRERLITEVTQAPSALYLATQHYWRAKNDLREEQLTPFRDALDAQYLDSRRAGTVLEHLLELYFPDQEPKLLMHRLMDLLTVRYFQLVREGGASEKLREANACDEHSGLSVAALNDPTKVLDKYHETLPTLIRAVAEGRLSVPHAPGEQ
jgi:hypothetical protein